MFFVYILYSATKDKYYVGQTEDPESRLRTHQSKISSYTSMADDWQLKYCEEFETRSEAIKREIEIKKKKSRKYIMWLIESAQT